MDAFPPAGSSLPTLLRAARRARGLSLGQLSARCGIHKASLSRWETGTVTPRTAELQATMDALELSPSTRRVWWAHVAAPRALTMLRQEAGGEIFLHPGDHLRALRLRSGKSQSEVGRAIGVSLSLIGKWERGETLAGGGEIHAFCHACGATAEEAAFVTIAPAPPREVTPATLRSAYDALIHSALKKPPQVHDVPFLTIAAQMETLIRRGQADIGDLATVWGRHVEAMNMMGRFTDAAPIAAQVRAAMLRDAVRLDFHTTPALMAAATNLAHTASPHEAVKFLEPMIERIEQRDSQAWGLAQLGTFHEQAGERAASLALGREALARVEDEFEAYFRRADLIAALLNRQRFDEALPLLELQTLAMDYQTLARKPEWELSLHWKLRDELLHTLAHGESGSFFAANTHFGAARRHRSALEKSGESVPAATLALWRQVAARFGPEESPQSVGKPEPKL